MKSVCALSVPALISAGIALLAGMKLTVAQHAVVTTPSPMQLARANFDCSANRSSQYRCPAGGLYVNSEGKEQVFPLKHTEVKAKIAGNLSRVEVTQTFENPFKEPLEAVYIFPLPDEAAVDDMEIKIGERIIKADIKKREEAQEIYEQAKREGRTAGLLEQERDNIFTQSLANIKPGEQIEVIIRYTDSLKFESGQYEFVFPMVVGPRYIPSTVPDADRINPPILPPGTRSGRDIGVTVEIDTGLPISNIRSTSHKIQSARNGNAMRVQLADADTIPNKDLILRYQVAGEKTEATILTQADQRGGHFAVYLIPALNYQNSEIVPKDVVFLMDTSGSQQGDPLAKSKALMRRFISGLNPNDTFTIVDFANTAKALSPTPLANTPANRQKAFDYIDQLQANGGTELLNGIRTVLNFPAATEGRLRSIVLLTDGYIGNDAEVIAEVQRNLKPGNRLYSFGVGSSVNRFLINRLAEVGRGTAQVIRQDEPTQEVAEKFFRQINNPVLTNIQINWQGAGVQPEIYPHAAPDLFANQPLVLFGRKSDRISGQVRVVGLEAGGRRYEKTLSVNFNGLTSLRQPESNSATVVNPDFGNFAIAQLWGRARIKDLMNQMFAGEMKSLVDAVTDTALAYRLLSQYTAFVAVSEEVRVDPDGTRRRVEVPVDMPEGVSYDGIFGGEEADSTRGSRGGGGYVTLQQQPMPTAPAPRGLADPETQGGMSSPLDRLDILSAEGLAQNAVAMLEQHLQSVTVPEGVHGELVFEILVQDGRVRRVIWDDRASVLKQRTVVESLQKLLLSWPVPADTRGTVRLKLRINHHPLRTP